MMIGKAQIEAQLQQVRTNRLQALANVHACDGAIQVLEQQLVECDRPALELVPHEAETAQAG